MSHYFHPEVGAPQARILESAQRLSARGHEVTVLTGFPNYPDGIVPEPYRGRLLMRETIGPLRVIRSAVYPAPNRGFARRLVNHASFAASSLLAGGLAARPDVIVAETPPLFTAAAAGIMARLRRVPLVLNVADLWPESAVQLGALSNPTAIALAEALERFAYRNSAVITVPIAGMRRTLLARGLGPDRVVHLANAVDVERFSDPPPARPNLQRVVYCGTVGMAQGVGVVIEAAGQLAGREPLEFLIVGDGAEREQLIARAAQLKLDNVHFQGRVTREEVPALLASADVGVLCLRDLPLFRDALPTKLLEYMAAGLPVVASAVGEVPELLERAQAGLPCPPEDPNALAEALSELSRDPAGAHSRGQAGQRYARAHHSREAFVEHLERVMITVTGEDPEQARVRRVYAGYASSPARRRAWDLENPGNQRIMSAVYDELRGRLIDTGCWPGPDSPLLDVGCGFGDFLAWGMSQGAPAGSLIGVDVVEERVAEARRRLPDVTIELADARELPLADSSVNAVVFSLVLSSVTGRSDRRQIAREALRVLRPGGVVLCYDLRWPNPRNPEVRAINRRELTRLFEGATIQAHSLTLLPPLTRRLGALTERLYDPLAALPLLRTHLLAVVRPQTA